MNRERDLNHHKGTSIHLALLGCTSLMLLTGCEDPAVDRISIRLADSAATWPIDLDPTSPSEGIDNVVRVVVDFDSQATGSTRTVEWSEFQIQYGFDGEVGPTNTGLLSESHLEGDSLELALPGATSEQLSWVFERYRGGEQQVPFRVALSGVFATTQPVIAFEEFTATFADYQPVDPDGTASE